MKKSIKVMTLSLLAVGMLAGCSSESPNWKSEYLKFMKENFYGEVLPYVSDFKDYTVTLREADGSVVVRGGEVSQEKLAEYAALLTKKGFELEHEFTADEDEEEQGQSESGLRSLSRFSAFRGTEEGGEEPAPAELPLGYTFMKEFDTEDGKRFLEVQFGGLGDNYEFTANGDFFLFAGDPFVYEWPADEFEVITLGKYGSDKPVPQFAADRYQFQDGEDEEGAYALVACYTSDKEAAVKYTATLAAATGWHVYGEIQFSNGSAYIADSPDGKYGLQYSYNEEEGYLIIVVTEANFLYSFPSEKANKYVKDTFGSDDAVPALPADHYRWFEDEEEGSCVICYPTSQAMDAGYSAVLEAAGWHVSFYTEEGDAARGIGDFYFAYSENYEYMVYYYWYQDMFLIEFMGATEMHYITDEWSSDAIDEVFTVFNQPSYSVLIPELEMASEEAYFATLADFDKTSQTYDGACVVAFELETEEFVEWLNDLYAANWFVDLITDYYSYYGVLIGTADYTIPAYGCVASIEAYYYEDDAAAEIYLYFLAPLATEFPSGLNDILEDNKLPTVPTGVEAQYYYFNSSTYEVYCYGVSSEEPDAGYSALFAEDENWILRNKDEQGAHEDPYYEMYIADSADGTISCYYYVEDDTLVVGIADILPFARTSWPADDITAIFEEQETTEYPVPAFEAESAYFVASADLDYTYASYGYIFFDGVEVDVKGATEEEINRYVTETLPGAGWTVDAEEGTATKKFVDFDEELFGQATIQFGEQDGVFYVYMNANLEAIQYESFPSADVAAYLASQGFTDTIPALSDAELATSYTFDPEYNQIIIVAADGKKADALEQYVADLLAAGWVEFGADSWGDMQYISPNSELLVCPWASSSSSNNNIYIDFSKAPSPDFPTEEINAFLEENGFTETIPALDSDLPKGYEVSSRGTIIVTLGSEDDAEAYLAEYVAALAAANWAEYGPDSYGDMQYISPKGELLVCPYFYGSTVYISIYAAPITSFPTEKIAASLEALGYTDVLPEYNGELATSFSWYDADDLQLTINCEVGDESDLVAAYKQVLLDAGWTVNGADQYGDTLYLSPNSQYEVTVWSAEDIGYEGFICIDFHFSE